MKERYYYLCSGGSIFTISTVGRRGRRTMGKYMKKAKSVKNMEVSQSSLLGVRTRARALALEKQTSENICVHGLTSSPTINKPGKSASPSIRIPGKSSESHRIPLKSEPHYMQLRSRRLEKAVRYRGVEKNSAGDEHNENELEFLGGRSVDHAPATVIPSCCRPHVDVHLLNEELLVMPARNSCSSRPDFALVGISSATAPDVEDVSHSRVTSPAQSSLHTFNLTAPAAISTPTLTIQQRGASRMVTRHQQQELGSKLTADAKVMDERDKLEAISASGNVQRKREIAPCFGESPTIAGPSGRERQQGPNTRSQKQDCIRTPDYLPLKVEVPGSTSRIGESTQLRFSSAAPLSRSTEVPFSAEIEAFFASAEQSERRRFIDRYNFDPLTEKPLKGRYLWLKE